MNTQSGSVVIDTGVLIEYLEDTALGRKFTKLILENELIVEFYLSPLVYTEILYIYCRKLGFEKAKITVQSLLQDFVIYDELQLREEAAKLKCRYAISLADCYSIALGLRRNIPVYMKKEVEIDRALQEGNFPANIRLLDDL